MGDEASNQDQGTAKLPDVQDAGKPLTISFLLSHSV